MGSKTEIPYVVIFLGDRVPIGIVRRSAEPAAPRNPARHSCKQPRPTSAPLDYVPWFKPVDDFARHADLKDSERWILISGKTTSRAMQELTTLDWRVSDNLAAAK